ncbi:MAG: response regulator [Patescibacteria group bacterium]|jgi:DNA-binding response OmpR family regulator|nr:response regulator [Patescibacteria group bacterium]MDD5172728.1 response regulator [Patescibacteria group bacterium]
MFREKKKVLIIEDEKILLYALKEQLQRENFELIFASDGEEGLKSVLDNKPDLVLLDLVMPKKNGLEVLKEMKKNKNPEIQNIPVIILSSLGQESEIREGLKTGAEEFLVKTEFSMQEITEKVKKLLNK